MSNTRSFSKKGRKKNQRNGNAEKPKYSIDDLLDKADEYVELMNPELAQKFYVKALEMDNNNTRALDSYAQLLLEMDDFERAKQLLEHSIRIEPDGHYSKYMNMGQLHEGLNAIKYFEKGVNLMIKEHEDMKSFASPQELQFVKQQISSAFCTMAEIFLTDSCFENNAETECEKYCNEAMKWDDMNPEPYHTMASVRISQERNDDALQILHKGYNLWKDLDPENLPLYEFRHNAAKLFMELDQPRVAAIIWEGMLEEDDTVAEVWYHLGLAYRRFNTSAAKENLTKAKQLLLQCKDIPFLKEVEQVLSEVQNENIVDTEEQNVDDSNLDNDDEDENEMDTN